MERIRPPAVAGSFYPAGARELKELLEHCFHLSPLGPKGAKDPSPSLFGGVVPHAGFIYSGPCAAHFYARLDPRIGCAVVLGVNHRGRGSRAALSTADLWETPLGRVEVNRELAERLKSRVHFLAEDERAHFEEHSIEVQLPFLQSVLEEFSFLPVSLAHISEEECAELGRAIAEIYESGEAAGKKTVVIATSDLSHYLSPAEAEQLDRLALEKVLSLSPSALLRIVEDRNISMCGVLPTAAFLFSAERAGVKKVELLKHCHSGDAVPMDEVVGYASVAVEC